MDFRSGNGQIIGDSNPSSRSQSQKDSQESVVFLGEWDSTTGAFVENGNHGAEEIMDIADQLSQNLVQLSANTSQNNVEVESDMDNATENIAANRLNETTVILTQPVWPISILPLSDSPRTPVKRPSLATTNTTLDTNNQPTDRIASEHSENGMGNIPSHSTSAQLSNNNTKNDHRQAGVSGESTSPEVTFICSSNVPSATPTTRAVASSSCRTPLSSGRNKRHFQRNIRFSRNTQIQAKRRKASAGMVVSPRNASSVRSRLENIDEVEAEPIITVSNSQIVSIHRICLETAMREFGRRAESYSELKLIEKIIEKSNYKIKDTEGEDCRTRTTFQRRDEFQMPTLSDGDKVLFSGDDFQCVIYVQDASSNNNFLSGYGLQEKENSKNCIAFYYRPGDIFALTTRHAWNAIQWCSDYDFPSLIAARLLNPEGQLKSTEKELTGNVRRIAKTRKICEGDNPLDIGRISTNYVADFRKNCSIFKFGCFNQNAGSNIQENVRVEVGFAYIRILKRLNSSDFLIILSHFSLVHKGELTFNSSNSEIAEKDSKIHSKNLTMVSNELSRKLESSLVRKIYNAAHNSGKAELDNYDFCHKHVEDYSLAESFHVFVGKEKVKTFSSPPTLRKIIEFMMSSDLTSCKNLVQAKSLEDFEKRFTKFRIGYTVKGRDKPPEKILNFVEGDIFHNDGRLYCKYLSKWCMAAPNYFALAHFLFQDMLKKHLISPNNCVSVQLRKPWPSSAEICQSKKENENFDPIEHYVNSYRDEERFYIPEVESNADEDDFEYIKLFDMMAIGDDGKIYIYMMQNGFSVKLRDASSQIKRSLNKMNSSNFGNTSTPTQSQSQSDNFYLYNSTDPIKRFYELCCDDNFFIQRFPDYHMFKSELKNSTIVFAIADPPEDSSNEKRHTIEQYFPSTSVADPSPLVRSLHKEKELPTKLAISELVTLLQEKEYLTEGQLQQFLDIFDVPSSTAIQSKVFAVAKNLYGIFREMKYVDLDGNVTSKLLLSTPKRFEIKGLENHLDLKNAIYKIIKSHQSQYKYLIPKIALDKIRSEVLQAGYQFKICAIPTTTTDS